MNAIKNTLLIFLCFTLLFSCVPENVKFSDTVSVDFKNLSHQAIITLQNQQKVDSLYEIFRSEDPTLRYLAVNAFASIKEGYELDSLAAMLLDPNLDVKAAAAYALGQSGNPKAADYLMNAFRTQDSFDVNNQCNANILEAMGKLGPENYLKPLSTVKSFRDTDTLLLEGQVRGIYRYALRGIIDPNGTKTMVSYLNNPNLGDKIKLIAANYLFRAKDIDLKPYKFQLVEKLSDPSAKLRMTVATGIGKTADLEMLPYLINRFKIETDYRVKINIINALQYFPYIHVADYIVSFLNDKDDRIAGAAADFLYRFGNKNDALIYKTFITDSIHPTVMPKMYRAVLANLPHYYTNTRNSLSQEILEKIEETSDVYIKADYIRSLGHDPRSYGSIYELSEENTSPPVMTSIVEALGDILKDEKFARTFKYQTRNTQTEIAGFLKSLVESGDVGAMAMAGSIISNPESQLIEIIDSTEYLIQARNNLKLPKNIETYNELHKAICYLQGRPFKKRVTDNAQQLDWSILDNFSDSTKIVVKTNKGNFTLKMDPIKAPGSVVNFLKLIQSDFYDGNIIHRVVPNFVMQAGCPRGDGYGGLDYTIQSELPQMYYDDEGYLGMASAGSHTECTQWFITHTATPHLDGGYTIFGKVSEGMDVVHALRIGDKIIDIIKL